MIEQNAERVDAIVVGAGVAGLYAMHKLRGLGLDVVGIEAADGVGGTWFWNRYPGCRCDVPTIEYSYSFDEDLEQEWSFSEVMSAQPEIEDYLNHVADRFDLRRSFRFSTRVAAATFDEATSTWTVETDRGERLTAPWCVMATGSLSAPNLPPIPGIDSFAGRVAHTGLWPREGLDVAGKRVGIIGTGSSGMQSIPHLAREAKHLTVFQRTPNYSFPGQVAPVDDDLQAYVKANYRELRRMQRASGAGISGMAMPPAADGTARAVGAGAFGLAAGATGGASSAASGPPDRAAMAAVLEKMEEGFARMVRKRVHDAETAESLIPKDYRMGCKRLVVEIDYFETYNRDNVTLVDLRKGPITEISPTSVRTEQGDFEVDVLVLATGFDALTGPLTRIAVRGREGRLLADEWRDGPRAYLGLMASGFPNLFMITGPGSPSVLSNMVVSIEQHVDWIADAIAAHRTAGVTTMEPMPDAEEEWLDHVQEASIGTPYTAPSCNSWYVGANIDGKTRVILPYTGGVGRYREICDEVAADGYRGFALSGTASA
ncbi:MAG TPA: NAD(P)/FAD-dependent oxidoreductase [Acidimicrobiales bacterium]|nr:NAD(P)/FAD-dependent oxidoreductase [Acidimicrobiales bacterium]